VIIFLIISLGLPDRIFQNPLLRTNLSEDVKKEVSRLKKKDRSKFKLPIPGIIKADVKIGYSVIKTPNSSRKSIKTNLIFDHRVKLSFTLFITSKKPFQ
jgi:hypothetical protein